MIALLNVDILTSWNVPGPIGAHLNSLIMIYLTFQQFKKAITTFTNLKVPSLVPISAV